MKTHWAAPLCLLVAAMSSCVPAPNREDVVRSAAESGEKFWQRLADPDKAKPGSRDFFTYALALCEAKMHPERLERLFELAQQMQDRDPKSKGYGNFRWNWADDGVLDYNAVDFSMQGGSVLWLRHRDRIPEKARGMLRELLELGVEGCLRHRVTESYTNIFLMNALDLILLGEDLDKPEVADEGYARLDRFCLYTWECGIHEYCSPTYYGTDLDSLGLIEAFAARERGRAQARALLELFWTDIALNWVPFSEKLGGARSRDYDYLRGLGYLDTTMWVNGWLQSEKPLGGTGAIFAALAKWRPPERLRETCLKRVPRLVRQRWGLSPCQTRTHYILSDVSLSASGANYGNMDIPLSVDLKGPRESVRCYFIPDGRHDPYGKVKIPAGLHMKTLHLKPFFAAAQRRADAVGLVVYRSRDLPNDTISLESHIVMPLAIVVASPRRGGGATTSDGFWIGDRPLDVANEKHFDLALGLNDPLVLRKGTAAVGVRVLWSRGLDRKEAPVSFAYDGNRYGAVRLTVTHHGADKLAKARIIGAAPGAAFWVRIGSGLKDDEAFDKWRREFAAAMSEVEAGPEKVRICAKGLDGPVVVAAASPYVGSPTLDPPPTRAVQELDGEDIGRAILRGIEPIARLARQTAQPAIAVAGDHGTYWEAEAGQVVPAMTIGEDQKASRGHYVWMPAKAGERGGSALGSVTWRLNVAKAGTYYAWGRVEAPTPENDSFYVRLFTETADLVGMATWPTGTHEQWTWTPMRIDAAQGPTPLPLEGEVSLQLRVREAGTKIDRLFITADPKRRPE